MKKPNVLLILIDDMGWRDLQCFGSEFYETPNIDEIAKEGTVFTQAYATCPVCSPSRASLLTGKYPARLGVTSFIGGHSRGKLFEVPYVDHLDTNEYSLPRAFKAEGYNTWHVGKWHLGTSEYYPEKQGFDVNVGGCHIGGPHKKGYFSPWEIENLSDDVPEKTYLTDHLTDKAIELLENKDENPFFMYLSHYAVHTPVEVKKEDEDRFIAKAKRMKLDQIDPIIVGENFPCDHKKNSHVERRIVQSSPAMAGMIWNLDYNVGRVIDTLKRTNQYENTIIIFTSDNGGLSTSEGSYTCNFPLSEGKGWMYDGGVRIPLIFAGPNIPKSVFTEQITTGTDIYPTLMELAGIDLKPEQHCDGESIADVVKGGEVTTGRPIFWHYPHYGNQGGTPGASVRLDNYKLIKFFEDDSLELYDLDNDISETFNLIEKEKEIAKKLENLLNDWLKDVGAVIPEKDMTRYS